MFPLLLWWSLLWWCWWRLMLMLLLLLGDSWSICIWTAAPLSAAASARR